MKDAMKQAIDHLLAAEEIIKGHLSGQISESEMHSEDGPKVDELDKPGMDESEYTKKDPMHSKSGHPDMEKEESPEEEKSETPKEEEEEDKELRESGMAPAKGTKIDEDKGKEAFMEGIKRKGMTPLSRKVIGKGY